MTGQKKQEAQLEFTPTPSTSLIVFLAWVPIQMQTPGGAFALWPRARREIDKQLLVSQTELKEVGVEGREEQALARGARSNWWVVVVFEQS